MYSFSDEKCSMTNKAWQKQLWKPSTQHQHSQHGQPSRILPGVQRQQVCCVQCLVGLLPALHTEAWRGDCCVLLDCIFTTLDMERNSKYVLFYICIWLITIYKLLMSQHEKESDLFWTDVPLLEVQIHLRYCLYQIKDAWSKKMFNPFYFQDFRIIKYVSLICALIEFHVPNLSFNLYNRFWYKIIFWIFLFLST